MASLLAKHHDSLPFANHKDLYGVIDATQLGDVPWQCFSVKHTGERPEVIPPWMDKEYDVWFRDPRAMAQNILANPTYKDEIDYDEISKDPDTHGSAFVPIILGSDKTTVSVGTGNNEYYPLYASIGNVHNNVRRAHRDALVIIGFLAIPKTDKKNANDEVFQTFRRQLYHSLLSTILQSLKPVMTKYEVVRCRDGHFRHIIYGIGPYIADYEEQVVLGCIVRNWCPKCLAIRTNLDGGGLYRCREHADLVVRELHWEVLWDEFGMIGDLIPFTNDFPRADIYELLSPDILHQLIKGAFKDHLVDWVLKYLKLIHGTRWAEEIMSDIDCRVAAVASFSGLQRFPQGRDFKQWTGDDSKALMKVFISAIEGHVHQDIDTLNQIEDALTRFHHYRQIFLDLGVISTVSLPCQHSMSHYADMIRLFGSPNGLCSSITESKHIKAVKEPWRWSSKHNALGQMLMSNQRLDKLAASRVDFGARGMLAGTVLSNAIDDLKRKRAQTVIALADELYPNDPCDPADIPAATCPRHEGSLKVFNSAAATFYAPSDPSRIGGMQCEHIRACPLWRNLYPRNDCVFVNTNPDVEGMQGLEVARVLCFFLFKHNWIEYPCALVQWFDKLGNCADEDTGMWMGKPSVCEDGSRNLAVIHIDTVYRAAHLIPIYGSEFIPESINFYHSYDAFCSFYVNKYADHHAFEIVS
ncbi:hypothetical protein EV702DRAFT_1180194 [Suillus placidus]|uniref:Uncharacterized protein n=1 Tax=Suillus placidus TaxID=48579 RepID=A0A9P6ZS44_9AGAM|nr:hypothetical protein EV702DRAFT_1180194 [Suillus placidus]